MKKLFIYFLCLYIFCNVNIFAATNHIKGDILKGNSDDTYHYYSCLHCDEKIKEAHEFKENLDTKESVCIICDVVYGKHKASSTWTGDGTYHYKKCMVDGCTEIFEKSEHYGGTHENGGVCSKCKKKYQTHAKDSESFQSTDKEHRYKCSYKNCNKFYVEEHEIGTEMGWDNKFHWYKCVNEDCDVKFKEANHLDFGDGTCQVCKRKFIGTLENFYISNITGDTIKLDEIGERKKLALTYFPENLADTNFIWKSDNRNIVTVTEYGVITAVSYGSTNIRVNWNGQEIKYKVKVGIDSFEIEADDDELYEEEETRIRILTDGVLEDDIVKWEVSPKKLGWMNKNYLHISPGEAKIEGEEVTVKAYLKSGAVAQTTVKVMHKEPVHKLDEVEVKCEICGIKTHKLLDGYEHNNNTHWKYCSNKKCETIRFIEKTHNSSTACSICGWESKSSSSGGSSSSSNSSSSSSSSNSSNSSGSSSSGGSGSSIGSSDSGGSTELKDEWVWCYSSTHHWQENKKRGSKTPQKIHDFDSTNCCKVCNYTKVVQECGNGKHVGSKEYISNGDGTHTVQCGSCNTAIKTEQCDPNGNCICNQIEKIDINFEIAKKVYYVEENGTDGYPVKISFSKTDSDSFDFKWTLSTVPNPNYNGGNSEYKEFHMGEVSSDGTIKFWYENGNFYAALEENNIQRLYEEVFVDITYIDKKAGRIEESQTIKLIKNGPPSSFCQIYLERSVISLNERELKLYVRTAYNDFEDEIVRKKIEEEIRSGITEAQSEFPIYKINTDDAKMLVNNVENGINDVIQIGNIKEIKKADEEGFNGYVVYIEVTPKSKGFVNLKINGLKTEYTFNKHRTFTEERAYTAVLKVVEELSDSEKSSLKTPPPSKEIPDNEDGGEKKSGATMAGIGFVILLFIFIGAKMKFHR